ncbi:MAG TPA: hypothetical protein VHD31_01070 [Candidatus Paceibacterota bacterium]|nr:hypothetical protein [Candidatus Paceibacterota bacterium]
MKLRGIHYGNILGASGVQGFFGEGYPFHRLLGPFGPRFDGMTFVAKTTTLNRQLGNMPLTKRLRPKELKPKCIWVSPIGQTPLNAIGLSGPGAEELLDPLSGSHPHPDDLGLWAWQIRMASFMISFMPVGKTVEERLEEMRQFVRILKRHLPHFKGKVALQINVTCPNVGLDPLKLVGEISQLLDTAAELNIPLVPKLNLLVPPETAIETSKHPACDAICISNTIPFGKLENKIQWKWMFPNGSPLKEFGGGGLSGPLLLPLVANWIWEAYAAGMEKPMNVGGGIMRKADIDHLLNSGLRPGVDSVFIGSVAMLRPWRVQGIIKHANKVLAA